MTIVDRQLSAGRGGGIVVRAGAFLIGLLAALSATPAVSEVPIQSRPLSLGNDIPNNLTLVPSVEFPTLLSPANFDMVNGVDVYNANRVYVGYFDSAKCYQYVYNADEKQRYFKPFRVTSDRTCTASNKEWSGNFMNWAFTQTIDPFRKALTGGYRVRDTVSETWLEKAVNDANAGTFSRFFPNKSIDGNAISRVMPITANYPVQMRLYALGSQVYFTRNETPDTPTGTANPDSRLLSGPAIAYNPATHNLSGLDGPTNKDARVYAMSIRVAVCVDAGTVKPEDNCVKYPSGYSKPEGLIQGYNSKFRFSAFSYLNDSSNSGGIYTRDGGVLRARQKYVGPYSYDPKKGREPNPLAEWDSATGMQKGNPDPVDAAMTDLAVSGGGTVVTNSGVINYINKFGQTTSFKSKSADNVAELYYAMVRYFKKQGNVPEYTNIAPANAVQFTDKFPVITDWSENPIQYRCQRNVALGIGDVYNNGDRNLPGATFRTSEPATRPPLVAADTTVNVDNALKKVFELEGITKYTYNGPYRGANQISAFIAALAYDSHTVDLQPNMPDKQTLDTYWVDVAEGKKVEERDGNQFYLATKYGGFDVPNDYQPYASTAPFPDTWWTNGDLVGLDNMASTKRPRNYFVAYQADKMVKGLTQAFAAAGATRVGAAGGLASNGATVEDGAAIYAPTFFTDWRGELTSYRIDPITKAYAVNWTASSGVPAPAARKIYANSNGYRQFLYSLLSGTDQTNLASGNITGATGQDVLDYLRGVRTKEVANGGPLRNRSGVLGDFVHSTPMYVGRPSPTQYAYSTFPGGGKAYTDFAAAKSTRAPVVYVGGNDGMLHGFAADTGVETYAFVPAAVLSIPGGLAGYASPNYAHRYFVDGELTAADVFDGSAWKTILVGTMGRGGNGVFALDITDPNDVKFLWEKYGSAIPGLGNNLSKPVITQTARGVWKVLLGNGPNSTGDAARLLVLDALNGSVTTVDTGVVGDNGLAGVRAWDSDNDGFADSAYAGDFAGNLWKFGNLGGSASITKLFTATSAASGTGQPITATPLVARKPDSTETWVFFGTGRYLGGGDLADLTVQSWYGVMDKGVQVSRSQMVARRIELEGTIKDKDGNDVGVRSISAASDGDMQGKAGWYIDLVPPSGTARGERIVVPNLFDGNRLLGISRIPDVSDPCAMSNDGWIMEIDPFTGARLDRGIFDANGDGSIDSNDYMPGNQSGGGQVPPSGVGSKGSLNPALIIPGKNGNIVTGTNQNGDTNKQPTPLTGLGVKRIAWREVLKGG